MRTSSTRSLKGWGLGLYTVALLAAMGGCYGFGDDGSGTHESPPTTGSNGLVCDPSLPPPVASLRRLTSAQYRITLNDLVTWALGDAKTSATLLASTSSLANLPPDARELTAEDPHGSFRRLDQTIQQGRVEAYYQIGIDLGHASPRARTSEK